MMIDITTTLAGLTLKNPIIAGSSGMTSSLPKIIKLAEAGVGAIVLKSIFEEQIENQVLHEIGDSYYPEGMDMMREYVRGHEVQNYLDLIAEARQKVSVPIIASMNCFQGGSWVPFAQSIEQAGAHAIEINVMRLETDRNVQANDCVQSIIQIAREVVNAVSIPVIVKLDNHCLSPVYLVAELEAVGVSAVTCFNRSYKMDVDIEKEQLVGGEVLTQPSELFDTLKYVGIISSALPKMSVMASGGIHDGNSAVKALLCGAGGVQVSTALYKHGASVIPEILNAMTDWMDRHGYRSVEEFCGRLRYDEDSMADHSMYERMQFMRYFSSKESYL